MQHAVRMLLVPEDLHRQLLAKSAKTVAATTNMETLAQGTAHAQQIHYTTAERRRRKIIGDVEQTPLLVDFPSGKNPLLQQPSSSKKVKKSSIKKEEPKTSITEELPIEPQTIEQFANPLDKDEFHSATEDEPVNSQLDERVRKLLILLKKAPPSFLGKNNEILKDDGSAYKRSNIEVSLKHLISENKDRSPPGTSAIKEYLEENLNLKKVLYGTGCPVGKMNFRPKLWTCLTSSINRRNRQHVSPVHNRC